MSWEDAFLLLYDAGNFDDMSILSTAGTIIDGITFNHILEHILNNLVVISDFHYNKIGIISK